MTGRMPFRMWAEGVYGRVRCKLGPVAPDGERCCMGAPVGDWWHCPRRALPDGLFCRRHDPNGEWVREVQGYSGDRRPALTIEGGTP